MNAPNCNILRIFCFFIVPIIIRFPKMFPKRLRVYPIWFAQSSILIEKLDCTRACLWNCSATGSPKRCFYWGVPNIPKKLTIGQLILLLQKKNTVVSTPMYLIYLLLIFTSVWKELQEEDKLPYPKVGFVNK